MPKTVNTRLDQAKRLVQLIKEGPASIPVSGEERRLYDLWATSWIIPAMNELIIELRNEKRRKEARS